MIKGKCRKEKVHWFFFADFFSSLPILFMVRIILVVLICYSIKLPIARIREAKMKKAFHYRPSKMS